MERFSLQLLIEATATEMDPNLLLIRLGKPLTKEQMSQKSSSIGTLSHGDTFGVSYRRADFAKKREAQAFARLNEETKHDFFALMNS